MRAVAVVSGFLLLLLIVLNVVPFPNRFRSPGVLQADTFSVVVAEVSGFVQEVISPDGSLVEAGQPLFRLSNRDLELRIEAARAQLKETEAMQRRALREATADLHPLQSRAEATRKVLARLLELQEFLVVKSPHRGQWVAPGLMDAVGSWLERGATVGQLVNQSSFYFSAIVTQNDASRLFSDEIRGSEVKLYGQSKRP